MEEKEIMGIFMKYGPANIYHDRKGQVVVITLPDNVVIAEEDQYSILQFGAYYDQVTGAWRYTQHQCRRRD
jgi:hypothetical protein